MTTKVSHVFCRSLELISTHTSYLWQFSTISCLIKFPCYVVPWTRHDRVIVSTLTFQSTAQKITTCSTDNATLDQRTQKILQGMGSGPKFMPTDSRMSIHVLSSRKSSLMVSCTGKGYHPVPNYHAIFIFFPFSFFFLDLFFVPCPLPRATECQQNYLSRWERLITKRRETLSSRRFELFWIFTFILFPLSCN